MSEIVNQSLQKIAKGTGIIFTGTIIGMLFLPSSAESSSSDTQHKPNTASIP